MDKNLVKKVAEVKHITGTESDLELFSKVTGLIHATEDMMNDENADWYVPAGAFIPSDSEMVATHVGEEVTDENKQYDVDNDGDIDEDDVTAAKEAKANSEIEVNEDDETPVEVASVEALAEIENPEETSIAVSSSEVFSAMTTNTTYKSISVSNVEVSDNDVKLNATDKIEVDSLEVSGAKGETNGKVIYNAPEVEFNNVSLAAGTTAYNVFEGTQDVNNPVSSVTLSNSTFDQATLQHNVVNVYTPAENANILIKDCTFSLNPETSNVLRISNIANASNVTVTFENVDWDYAQYNGTDFSYGGLVMYQAYGADVAYSKATTPTDDYIKTWNFVFKNCKYNGTKVTENNYGEEAQVIYAYDVMTNGKTDATSLFTVTFE